MVMLPITALMHAADSVVLKAASKASDILLFGANVGDHSSLLNIVLHD